jgi:hypothetical protein
VCGQPVVINPDTGNIAAYAQGTHLSRAEEYVISLAKDY